MEPTIELLKKALRICADAHHVEYKEWTADSQIGIHSESIPVVSDVRMICEAFCGNTRMMETDWGYITIYLEDVVILPGVDETSLRLALPFGAEL